MTDAPQRKRELRAQIRAQEQRMTQRQRTASDCQLRERFLALPEVCVAESVLLFASMGAEPDIWPLLDTLMHRGKRVFLPRCLPENRMEAREYRPGHLQRHRFGMLEPDLTSPAAESEEIALVLVPALCYDRRGFRLGRGGGYYDRFLARYPGCTAGLCRGELLQTEVPREAHDRPVALVVTERRVLRPRETVFGGGRQER